MLGMKGDSEQTPIELPSRQVLQQPLNDTHRFVIVDLTLAVLCIHDTLCRQRVS